MDLKTFGEFIKNKRLQLNQTREVFSDKVGISASYLNSLERGLKNPSPDLISAIADYLEMKRGDLFSILAGGEPSKPKSRIPDLPPDPPLEPELEAVLNDPRLGGIFYSKPYLSRLSNRQLRQIALDALSLQKELDEGEDQKH
jgi:transcriptional regulator with XRE-family HTH domain